MIKVSGDNQSALAGTPLAEPLVVQVLDGQSNPIPNRAVTWIPGSGDGSVDPQNTTTDAQGFASTRWTLGPAAGANSLNAVVSGVETVTFTATGTAGAPSASTSEVTAAPTTINAGGTSTITVTVRDASNNPVAGASVTVSASGSGNTITPGTASTNASGVATFSFSSTVAEDKVITATASGVLIEDQATVTVQRVASTVEITSDEPDASTVGEQVTIEFTVSGAGGPPTGDVTVTVSNALPGETCSESLTDGSGSCTITFLAPGTGPNNRRVLTASYTGDARFAPDTDTEIHRVNPAPAPNQPPTAAFNPPSCTTGQPCQFNDASDDSDGDVESWSWSFGDGGTSSDEDPTHTYAAAGDYPVTLTVTDDDGAMDSETHTVTVTDAPPPNTAPVANDDAYTATAGERRVVGFDERLLLNDTDNDAGDIISAEFVDGPTAGAIFQFESNGTFEYQPSASAVAGEVVTFRYRVRDLQGVESNIATVTITIQ